MDGRRERDTMKGLLFFLQKKSSRGTPPSTAAAPIFSSPLLSIFGHISPSAAFSGGGPWLNPLSDHSTHFAEEEDEARRCYAFSVRPSPDDGERKEERGRKRNRLSLQISGEGLG